MLQSKKNGEIYTGSTNDLRKRVSEHNNEKSKSTKRYAPWELIYYEAYKAEDDARIR
ncbi:MAG TPA: GIY-YIG nuclease family protein, partial [Patescibacteria group bacterium]|nr:GIY-YIG nuclease family protein [Patescibacteria group bacterium]